MFNNGVRKLDDDEGRFTSIDPLWEQFPAWSPYQYGYNNPIAVTDPGGKQALPLTVPVGGVVAGGTVAGGTAAGAATGGIIGALIGLALGAAIDDALTVSPSEAAAGRTEQPYRNMEDNSAAAPVIPVVLMAEHTKGARPSTTEPHEKGPARERQRLTDKKRQKDGWEQNPNKRKPGKGKKGKKGSPAADTESSETTTSDSGSSSVGLDYGGLIHPSEAPR